MLRNLLKSRDQATIDHIQTLVGLFSDRVFPSLQLMSDFELTQASQRLKVEVESGKVDIQQRRMAFALVKEAVHRTLKLQMYDVQLVGGWVLCEGKVAEMKTGEGKTLVSLLPAYWFALQGKGVHIITVNEYLAQRDYTQMVEVFRLLGVSVGFNRVGLTLSEKLTAYKQDITYGTCSEFGFDYLRDHLVHDAAARVQRGLVYAIVDEIDSILIDEARTPLIIAGNTKAAPDLYYICARFVAGFKQERDYEVDLETRQVMFTDVAVRKIETTFSISNLFDLEHISVYHSMLQSLRAKVLFRRDVEYIVAPADRDAVEKVHLIDPFTGRFMEGRQYSEGLHQAIEAKENVPLSEETRTHGMITIQKFFSLYGLTVGMTGTAKTEEDEFRRIYGLDVVVIPTHKPVIRKDEQARFFLTKIEKYSQIANEIQLRYQTRQPVLIGTTSIQQSEEIALLIEKLSLPFRLLNAKSEAEEAAIIASAGQLGAITIATNMAGRGTDISLGVGVAALGGLCVIGTELHESRRVDMQLRGRAGRQGDPGCSQFFVSLEDDLWERFAADEVEELCTASAQKLRVFAEKVQSRVEKQMFTLRTMVYQLDSIIHEQRQSYYEQRNVVVELAHAVDLLATMSTYMTEYIADLRKQCCSDSMLSEEWNLSLLQSELHLDDEFRNRISKMDDAKLLHTAVNGWWSKQWELYSSGVGDQVSWTEQWRLRMLQVMDRYWQEHLDQVEQIKQGIHYQGYAQLNPILAYETETWKRFTEMGRNIQQTISRLISKEVIVNR